MLFLFWRCQNDILHETFNCSAGNIEWFDGPKKAENIGEDSLAEIANKVAEVETEELHRYNENNIKKFKIASKDIFNLYKEQKCHNRKPVINWKTRTWKNIPDSLSATTKNVSIIEVYKAWELDWSNFRICP